MSFWISFKDQNLNAPTLPLNFTDTCKSYLKSAATSW